MLRFLAVQKLFNAWFIKWGNIFQGSNIYYIFSGKGQTKHIKGPFIFDLLANDLQLDSKEIQLQQGSGSYPLSTKEVGIFHSEFKSCC